MATTFNLQQNSLMFLNNQQIHESFKLYPFSSFKFPLNPLFMQFRCDYSKPLSTLLLKPFLKPLITLSTKENATIHPFGGAEPLFFGGGWSTTLERSERGDARAWSRRRPGSKSSGKKSRMIIALECTGCSGNRYITEKRRVARVDNTRKAASEKKKEDKKAKSTDALMLSKYCPKCRKHVHHKEVKIGTSK